VGTRQDDLLAWLEKNRLTMWNWAIPARLPGAPIPPGVSVLWVALPGRAGRDSNFPPLRSDMYVILDRDHLVASYSVKTYPQKGEWERWIR
jgi:hypothetical protein